MSWKRIWSTARDQQLDRLVPLGPKGKTEKMIKREVDRQKSIEAEASLLDLATKFWSNQPPIKLTEHQLNANVVAYTSVRGPYVGRKRSQPFKRPKWVRNRPARLANIAQKMEGMPARIETYRKVGDSILTSLECLLMAFTQESSG